MDKHLLTIENAPSLWEGEEFVSSHIIWMNNNRQTMVYSFLKKGKLKVWASIEEGLKELNIMTV